MGNGFCNDITNYQDCYFDGGDCCGSCVISNYCSECVCLDPEAFVTSTLNPLLGNGYCNDEANNENCNFDGGDCCGPCINTKYCIECECLLTNASKQIWILTNISDQLLIFISFSLW